MNRRAFFKSFSRNALLLSFATFGIVGIRRGKIKQRSDDDCPLSSPCRECGRLADCRQPEAVSLREKNAAAAAMPPLDTRQ